MENKDRQPIYYKTAKEMEKPLSELMMELRSDIVKIRGKLSDIRRSYGWKESIDFIEGGLGCILVSMYSTMIEWEKFEKAKTKGTK